MTDQEIHDEAMNAANHLGEFYLVGKCVPDMARIIHECYAERIEALEEGRRNALHFIEQRGYRRCDIPACNCNSWHGGHIQDRFDEISEVIEPRNGETLLAACKRVVARIAELESEVEKNRELVDSARTILKSRDLISGLERDKRIAELTEAGEVGLMHAKASRAHLLDDDPDADASAVDRHIAKIEKALKGGGGCVVRTVTGAKAQRSRPR